MPDNSRIPGLDIVRCAAIFLVVLQHSWTMLDMDVLFGSMQAYVYSSVIYGVALFVMLSGALQMRKVEPVFPFYKRRLVRILVPFLIWGTITYAISAVIGKYPDVYNVPSALKMYLPFLLTGKINDAFWFVYLILALYLVTPFLQRVFCRESVLSLIALALASVIWVGIEVLGLCQGLVGTFVFYLGFFLIGCLVMRFIPNAGIRFYAGMICSAVFLGLNIWFKSRGQEIFLIQTAEIISLFLFFSGFKKVTAFSVNLSRYSYFIYLTHFMIIRAMYMFFPQVFVPVWYMPVAAALLVICLEYAICHLLECFRRIPLKAFGI